MYKLVDSQSFFKDEPQVTILDLQGPSSGLEKSAADSRISEFVKNISPKPGKCYLHINAMGAGEYYGANRNQDYFPEQQLIDYHKTFETSPAHLFRHHVNKDPRLANGVVIFAIYNERMHRVELIVEADKALVEDIEDRIAMGDFPATSMATKTPYDTCSICGNRAHTRQEYCSHLTRELGKVLPDGRKVFAINNGPLKFFDISIVIKPADPTSSILQKVAGVDVVGSAEAAETEGLSDERIKSAEFKKLSELVKEISDGIVVDTFSDKIDHQTKDLPLDLAKQLSVFETNHVLHAMANLGISPSLSFIAEMIALRHLGEKYEGIGPLVEAFVYEADGKSDVPMVNFAEPDSVNPFIEKILHPHVSNSSTLPEYVEKRASQVGYLGNGPYVEPLPHEVHSNVKEQITEPKVEGFLDKYSHLLLGLAGSALLAKWYISKTLESKLKQPKNNVKIVIIKQASDYTTASKFSRIPVARVRSYRQDNEQVDSGSTVHRLALRITRRILNSSNSETARKVANVLKLGGSITAAL